MEGKKRLLLFVGASARGEASEASIGSRAGVTVGFAVATTHWVILHGAHGIRTDFGGVDARFCGGGWGSLLLAGSGEQQRQQKRHSSHQQEQKR